MSIQIWSLQIFTNMYVILISQKHKLTVCYLWMRNVIFHVMLQNQRAWNLHFYLILFICLFTYFYLSNIFCRYVLSFFKVVGYLLFREFIEKDLVDFAKVNPGVVVYLKPRRHRSPCLKAEYCMFLYHLYLTFMMLIDLWILNTNLKTIVLVLLPNNYIDKCLKCLSVFMNF